MSQKRIHEYFKVVSSQKFGGNSQPNLYQSKKKGRVSRKVIDGNTSSPVKESESTPMKMSPPLSPNRLKRTISDTTLSPKKKSPKVTKTSPAKYLGKRSPRKVLFKERVDTAQAFQAIQYMNGAREGRIGPNNFDLEELYLTGDFNVQTWSNLNADGTDRYKVKDVVIPHEKHADHQFNIIIDVFANPLNGGYFDEDELDFIFSILTLSANAQKLLVRLLKRKHAWLRDEKIIYPEIGNELTPFLQELEIGGFCTSDTTEVPMEILLQLLKTEELRDVCIKSKVDHRGGKGLMTRRLLNMANSTKALFPGMGTPSGALRDRVSSKLGHCIRLTEKIIGIMYRILTLFMPSQDVLAKISDTFLTLTMVYEGTMHFPTLPVERHPLFPSRDHLMRYVEGKNALRDALLARDDKEWETLLKLGRIARDRVMSMLQRDPESPGSTAIPSHVLKFTEIYIWIRVLMTSLESFKKNKENIPEMVEILQALINQKSHAQVRKGKWYDELALIEMYYNKNLEASARLTVEGLMQETLSEVDVLALSQRAEKLLKRRNGLSVETKSLLKDLAKSTSLSTPTVTIEGKVVQGNVPGRKTMWSLDMDEGSTGFMKVEHRAMFHYKRQGFQYGLHCEAALPITLFTLLLWDELYTIPIPGAFASPYQTAPLDIHSTQFYTNRKQQIDSRLSYIVSLDACTLANLIESIFVVRQNYISLMPSASFFSGQQLKEVVQCLGPKAVAGICQRLAKNFYVCKSGFPDLIVWNPTELKCKIVEVKGPGDTLSGKQTLWLRYLEEIGVSTELCVIQAKGSSQRRKR